MSVAQELRLSAELLTTRPAPRARPLSEAQREESHVKMSLLDFGRCMETTGGFAVTDALTEWDKLTDVKHTYHATARTPITQTNRKSKP